MSENTVPLFITSTLQEVLKGYDWFLGGSHRFQYNFHRSDVDIFIYEPSPYNPNNQDAYNSSRGAYFDLVELTPRRSLLEKCSLQFVSSGYPGQHWRTSIFGTQMDFIFFYDRQSFDRLLDEHNRVELLLSSNPILLELLLVIEIKGQRKYRALKALVR